MLRGQPRKVLLREFAAAALALALLLAAPTPAAARPAASPKPAAKPGAAKPAAGAAKPKPAGAAAAARPPTVAFQGSGLLGSYYSGVADVLVGRGVIGPKTKLAGISGGAYAAAATALGVSGAAQAKFWKSRLVDCATRYAAFGANACVGRLNSVLAASMFKNLPDNSTTERVNGRVRIAVSQLNASSTSLNNSAAWVIDNWRSKNDLISCLTTTDFLPCWTAPTTYTIYRNQPAFDGGYGNGYEELCPGGTAKSKACLKVAAWIVSPKLADQTCSPTLCAAAAKVNCSYPGRLDRIKTLYSNPGYIDEWPIASVRERCPTSSWEGEAPNPLPALVPMDTVTPDIMPGKYNPLPFWPPGQTKRRLLSCEWKSWSDTLPAGKEMEAMDAIFDMGRRDAGAWCKEHGC
ncbi:MAG: hypothetical protein J3K34DRAFT_261597 [Monoraphidium minutum]|nr:MAG: hypothetical protein J3K34DRAFT_261597 [Monoraphidium minutum]